MGNTGGDQSELDRALEFYDAEDYASAEPILRREAERGSDVAQFKLGNVLDRTGREEEAIVFLRKAVEAGNADAMINLGSRVGFDEGVDLYERAIAAGVPSGVACLGHHLWNNGQKERARDLLEDAAKKGDAYAAGRLAAQLSRKVRTRPGTGLPKPRTSAPSSASTCWSPSPSSTTRPWKRTST